MWPSRHPGPNHGDEKENDPDVSGNDTDKENRAVVCRAPPSSAPVQVACVLFDDLLGARAGTRAAAGRRRPVRVRAVASKGMRGGAPLPGEPDARAGVWGKWGAGPIADVQGKRGRRVDASAQQRWRDVR